MRVLCDHTETPPLVSRARLPRLAAPNEDTSCSISPRSSSPRSSSPGSAFHVASRGKERDYPSDGHLAGYGGFVPTSQNHFGTSFGLTTQSARSPNKPLSPSRRASNNGSISPRTNVPGYGGNCKTPRVKRRIIHANPREESYLILRESVPPKDRSATQSSGFFCRAKSHHSMRSGKGSRFKFANTFGNTVPVPRVPRSGFGHKKRLERDASRRVSSEGRRESASLRQWPAHVGRSVARSFCEMKKNEKLFFEK